MSNTYTVLVTVPVLPALSTLVYSRAYAQTVDVSTDHKVGEVMEPLPSIASVRVAPNSVYEERRSSVIVLDHIRVNEGGVVSTTFTVLKSFHVFPA